MEPSPLDVPPIFGATSIDFMKYGFFGKASRSFYNDRLSLSLGHFEWDDSVLEFEEVIVEKEAAAINT